MDVVGAAQPRAGQRQPVAERARQPGQDVGGADIWEQRDRRLGHGEQCVLAHHARAVVNGEPDAAAHAHAVDERDPGLREAGDALVDAVFLGEEGADRGAVARHRGIAHALHVAAGAEGAAAGAFQDDQLHRRIVAPFGDGRREVADHAEVEGVQRAGAVHQDGAGMAFAGGDQAGFAQGGVLRCDGVFSAGLAQA
jgi:hypothetical protein